MSIVLISDSNDFISQLMPKLFFLREKDRVITSAYENADSVIKSSNGKTILIHENTDKNRTLELVKTLRTETPDLFLMLLSDDEDLILESYDFGINEFASPESKDYELVIRCINNLKNSNENLKMQRNIKLLEQAGIIDSKTGLYNYKYAKQIMENEIKSNDYGILMVVAIDETLNLDKASCCARLAIRAQDILTYGKERNLYFLLPDTDNNGAICVFNKFKEIYNEESKFYAGISYTKGKTFELCETKALKALNEAVEAGKEYICLEDDEDWLDENINTTKNYKIFKQIYCKKLENIITPVFFRMQRAWEEKLSDTVIEQYVAFENSIFKLKNTNQVGYLKITYHGFAKVLISIIYEGLDSPENREISLSLSKISSKELSGIIEDFINEFEK